MSTTSPTLWASRPSGSFRSSLGFPLKFPQGAQRREARSEVTVMVASPFRVIVMDIPEWWVMVTFSGDDATKMESDMVVGGRVKRPLTCENYRKL